ncbi:polysaccharide lyase family 1 protein [Cylindrobasidium torrendii FP15055 ss-10]|uniref:Polysaccharide lyase family 1 protein n=1 Tax=Cylindrobasidium torrendii FP15055 ss-10 TaxID=1314674 RepID=A0A0D7BAL9_9AGAR|nr:polysaccharide lyase family 1 protein [Cylindrobasidium torrendii FP15055 ss-10]
MHLTLLLLALAHVYLAAAQLVGYATENGGTTGGQGGATTTVSSAAAFKTAISTTSPIVVYLAAPINYTGQYSVESDTSIIGIDTSGSITGGGLKISDKSNIIVQNLLINNVVGQDAITVTESQNVWIDHNEFYSDTTHGPDYYDGQVDITHACDYVTVSWNYFHDHYKSSLVGASCGNEDEDAGHFHITYHHNYWQSIHTRTPAMRFSHGHLYNNYYDGIISQGIHSRCDAEMLVEGNVFVNSTEPLSTYGLVIPDDSPNTSPDGDLEQDGHANLGSVSDNDWGTGKINMTSTGNFTSVPYAYNLTELSDVAATVIAGAGIGKV